jgi:tetratricopeptide (TPR) repeat protein
MHLGLVAMQQGDRPRARHLLDEALVLAQDLGDTFTLALSLHNRGCLAMQTGEDGHAGALLGTHLGISLHEIGNIYYEQQAYEAARLVYAESLDLFTQLESNWGDCARNNLGSTLFHLGDTVRARELHREALVIYLRKESTEGLAWTLLRLGVVEAENGDAPKAAQLLGAASAVQEELGTPPARWDHADQDQALASLRARMPSAEFEAMWAEGRALTPAQAVDIALSQGVRST